MQQKDYTYKQLDERLSWEACMARDSARELVETHLMPVITDCYEEGRFPPELVPEIAVRGFLGIKTDPKYGGHGASNEVYGVICRETERGDSGLRSFISVQNSLVMFPIQKFGSEEQKKYWLPLLASGKAIGAFGLTDIKGGSDPEGMHTHAKRDGTDFILNGSKRFITSGTDADFVLAWAKLDGAVRCFLVEKGTRGFEAVAMKRKGALRASDTAELFFNDVRIPAENLLPGTMDTRKAYLHCLNEARYGIAWGVIGAASFCAEAALAYLDGRTAFGEKLKGKQLIQRSLAFMDTRIRAAQLLAFELTHRKESGAITPVEISIGKRDNAAMARDVIREARDLMGADGIMLEYGVMRHLCNIEAVYTYEGTDAIHTLAIGRWITGEDAF